MERQKTIDISVTGNRLFYANGILTHNCGYGSSDMDATNIAESIGILMTADFVLGLIRTPELDEQGHVLLKQIKSRYGDVSYMNRFICGFDRARMKLYDIEDQSGIINETQKSPEEEHMHVLSESKELKGKPSLNKKSADGWSFD